MLPAAVVVSCATIGLKGTVPALEMMDWPAVIKAEAVPVDDEAEGSQEDIGDRKDIGDKEDIDEDPDEDAAQISDPKEMLKDGVYYGSGEGYGGIIRVKVAVSDGKISSIDIIEADGETPDFLAKAKEIIPRMLNAQSANVDGISGATRSSNGIRAAVANALSQAGSTESVPETLSDRSDHGNGGSNGNGNGQGAPAASPYTKPTSGWKDGVYEGSARGYGGVVTARVRISGGKISDITADGPGESPSYWEKAQTIISQMLTSQDPRVDAASGATYSSNGIINAVIAALEQAKNGDVASPAPSIAAEKKEQTIITGKDFYSVKVGSPAFSLKAKAKTALHFRSSKTSVVKVSQKGRVTIIGEGTARIKITAKADQTYKKAEKVVTVTVSAADSQLRTGRATVQPDEKGQFTAYEISLTITFQNGRPVAIAQPDSNTDPTNQEYLNRAFKGMKNSLLTVSDASRVDMIDGVSGATCSSRALREAYKNALSKTDPARKDQILSGVASKYDLTVDQQITLKIKGAQGRVSFSSDKENVARVSSDGKVTAVGSGSAVITITAAGVAGYNEAEKTVTINVTGRQQTITMPGFTGGGKYRFTAEDVGKTIPLQAETSGGSDLSYQSSDEDVAAISPEGVVTIVGQGTTVITVAAAKTSVWQAAKVHFFIEITGPDEPEDPPGITGTFSGSARGYGGKVTADVVLDDGVITEITVTGAHETRTYWLQAKTLVPLMISGQTWDVDAVSGATYSSNGIRNAVKNALESAGMTGDVVSGG